MTAKTAGRDVTAEIAFLTRSLKAPTLREAVPRLADRARAESWTHEEFLAACLQREVSARESHGGEGRIRAARFPARKALEDFDYDHQRSLKRETIAHLGTLDFVTARDNVVFLGPPGTGKTMLSIGLGIRACQAGHRVLFATAAEWVARLAEAHHAGRLLNFDPSTGWLVTLRWVSRGRRVPWCRGPGSEGCTAARPAQGWCRERWRCRPGWRGSCGRLPRVRGSCVRPGR